MLDFLKNPTKWRSQFKLLKPSTQLTILLVSLAGIILLISLFNPSRDNVSEESILGFGLDVFLKLGIVILIIYIAAYLFRRFGIAGLRQKTKRLAISETLPLSAKRTLYIVEVGEQELLLGATDQTITVLKTINKETDKPEIFSNITLNEEYSADSIRESSRFQKTNN